jgi:hypothetical protein
MIDRDEIKSFLSFCDSASDRQLAERRAMYEKMIGVLQVGSDLRRDFQFLLRKLIEEQVARVEVNALAKKRR